MKILHLLTNIMYALGAYIITGWSMEGTTRVCLSNESPLEGIVYYWETERKRRGMESSSNLDCRVGEGELKRISNKTLIRLIEEVQLSTYELKVSCEKSSNDTGLSIDFNGLDDTEPGHHIVDCEKMRYVSDLGVTVGDGLAWDSRYNESYKQELLRKDEKLREFENELSHLKLTGIDDKNEIMSLIRENQMLQHRISNLTGSNENKNNSLRILKNELMQAESHRDNLEREILNHKDRHAKLEGDFIKLKSSMFSVQVVTTVLPLLSLVGTSLAATPIMLQNPYPHVKNRVGSGLYRFTENEDDPTCAKLDYGHACAGFDYMIRPDKYPFFNSHVMHHTPLEAYVDKILESSGESCEIAAGKDIKCLEQRKYMKGHCPNGINGVYFINDKGKLSHARCKAEDHEITEDCTFCRRMKKKNNKSVVMKTSVSLQDAFCQNNSESYTGPQIPFKGVCSIGSFEYKRCEQSTSNFMTIPFVVFKNKGKIYLEKLITKNIEVVESIPFICFTHKGQDNQEVEISSLKRVQMSECKNINNSKEKYCTGDHTFCEKYGCSGTYPEYKCIMAPGAGPVLVNILGNWVKPQCIGYETVLVKKEVKVKRVEAPTECETCIYNCEPDGLKITSTGFQITSGVSCSHGSCISQHQEPSTSIKIPYPGMFSAMGGHIGIHLSHTDDSLSLHMRAYCDPQDVCETHHCFFCVNGIVNYQCHSILSSLIVSILLSIIIYFVLIIIGKMLYFFKVIPKKLRSPFMWLALLFRWVIDLVRSTLSKLKTRLNRSIGWDGQDRGNELREVRVRRPIPRFAATLSIICLLTTGALACSETLISNSKQTKCVQSSDKVKCSVSATVTLKAGIIGAESCFILKGPMENQRKTIRIKTLSSELVCREGNSFWTSHYSPTCLSSRRCHLMSDCTGNRCQRWTDEEVSQEFKGVNDNMVMNENKCFEQCGAAGCGCFNINPSCLFVHSSFRSVRPEAIRVFSCADWVHRLSFLVYGPNREREEISLGSLGTKFLSWGTISLSLDAEGITGTNSISFLESSKGGFALHDEAFSEIPREGFLGEIRCSSESAAISAHSSCIRAPNLIKYKPMTDQIDCTASLVDPFAAFVKGSLPQVRNGMTFTSSKDKKTIQAFNSGSIKAMVTINLDDYEIEFLSDIAKCEATFVNLTGCYSCNYGARVCVRVKTDRDADFVATQVDQEFHLAFAVWNGVQDYCQTIHFNKPEIDSITKYSCGGEERMLHIKGLLISLGVQDLRNSTGGASIVVNPSDSSWSLTGWASGLISWLGGSWMAVLKIIGFLLLGFLCAFIMLSLIKFLGISYLRKKKLT
ncbi:polyprotein [Chandiru virus]|uniref:Envelopment polyprotein n=1 Tax=Chandiru virus TaxID=629725 RepID=F2W3Q1_9VIRU|nr:polyprotein [Chandiru virus]AEA30045.1 polyprotein [Chandiru virus]